MKCMEAQALITPFINDKLDIATLEQFIDHVLNCKDCKDELEVYYALLTAIKQLDEDEEVSNDFSKELDNKIKESQERILRTKLVHIRKRVVFILVAIFVGLFTSVSVSVVEEVLMVSKETAMNQFVLQNEVLAPYMNNKIVDHLVKYQVIQDDIAQMKEEEEYKAKLREEQLKKNHEMKVNKQLELLLEHARKDKYLDNNYPSIYAKSYEQASEIDKLRLKDEMNRQKIRTFDNDNEEYSR